MPGIPQSRIQVQLGAHLASSERIRWKRTSPSSGAATSASRRSSTCSPAGRCAGQRSSGTPGKTRLINHFLIDNRVVPGRPAGLRLCPYRRRAMRSDFAKTHHRLRAQIARRCTSCSCWWTSRLEPQKIDLRFIRDAGHEHGIPFGIVFTKADKLSSDAAAPKQCRPLYKATAGRAMGGARRRCSSRRAPTRHGA